MKKPVPLIIAIDFDGTCVDQRFPRVGRSAPGAAKMLRRFVRDGHKLILWTMRSGGPLQDALAWFRRNDVELWGVNANPEQADWTSSPKAYAQVYIDDAALGCPLVKIHGLKHPCVDWAEIRHLYTSGRLGAGVIPFIPKSEVPE